MSILDFYNECFMNLRKNIVLVSILMLGNFGHVVAQALPGVGHTHNHAVKKIRSASTKQVNTLFFPDFYDYQPTKKGDTTWSFECSDNDLHIIRPYDLNDVNDIGQIKYYISFYQYPVKPGAIINPPYLSSLVYKFAHPGPDKWIGIDPVTGQMARYTLYKSKIVRTEDLEFTDQVTGKKRKVTYKYFKTERTLIEPGQTP